MKIYAVFDTNILVSATISKRSDTAVVLALDTLLNDEVTPLYNDEISKNITTCFTVRSSTFQKPL